MEGSNFSLLIKKFSRYKIGVVFFWILAIMYLIVILGGFMAPYTAGTPYQNEAAEGGRQRELYSYYKDKTMHPPTGINLDFSNGLRAYTKEYKRLEKPGYNIFVEIGVENSLNDIINTLKGQSVSSIINNYPMEKGGKPTYIIKLINKFPNKVKGEMLKLANSTEKQKPHITEIIIQTIDKEIIRESSKEVVANKFSFDLFLTTVSQLAEKEDYSKSYLSEIYESDFSSEDGMKVAYEVLRQKEGMVIDVIIRKLGAGGSTAKQTEKQLIGLFDTIVPEITDGLKKYIDVKTQTYLMDDSLSFDDNLAEFERMLDAYKSMDNKYKEGLFENHLTEFPQIIVETVMKYLEFEVPSMTVEDMYNAVLSDPEYKNLSYGEQGEFRGIYSSKIANNKNLNNAEYNNIKNKLPQDFRDVVENTQTYLNTTLKGLLENTPNYVAKELFKDKILSNISNDILNKKYSAVKSELPKELVNIIDAYQKKDFTVKEMIRYIIPKKVIEEVPTGDFTSVNSRDDLQDAYIKDIYSEIPKSMADLFKKYSDFTGKTVNEILEIMPFTTDEKSIPTLNQTVINMYKNQLSSYTDMPVSKGIQKDQEKLNEYLKSYIKNERFQYEHTLSFFVEGERYKLFWVFETNIHFFGTTDKGAFYLMGADEQGRCILSRIIHGGAISLSIGFLGMFLSLTISITIGGLAGYFGGMVDWIVMRICELVLLFPSFYLLLALRGILPSDMEPAQRFVMIVIILSFMSWASTARVIRGFILSGKNQDFVIAAKISGIPTPLIIIKHLLPQISSYLIVSISIGVPGYIVMETSLSWLGFGISEPSVSWGLMLSVLKELSIISVAVDYPWLFFPAVIVSITIMCFQLIGDAVRDTLDPMVKR